MLKEILCLETDNQIALKDLVQGNMEWKDIPSSGGIYAFWWVGNNEMLKSLYREVHFQGKVINIEEKDRSTSLQQQKYHQHKITWDWNIDNKKVCMYVGKTHNLQNRLKQHLELGTKSEDWYTIPFKRNQQEIVPNKQQHTLVKRTTACQMRAGIEHLFKNQLCYLTITEKANFFSYSFFKENCFKERFYLEDLAIGCFRPWFNLDSER